MKTSYNIIWVDDEPNSTDTDQEDVKDFLGNFGIKADITFVEAPPDGSIKEKLVHHLKNPDLDLLMVDYNMVGLAGDQLINLIRETDHIYLPVIFYSSSTVEELHKAVQEAALDGVYIANRDFLIQKFGNVVKSLLVKEQTVKQVRGLLMEGVSEIDARFYDIFFKAWNDCSSEQRTEIEQSLRKIVSNREKEARKNNQSFPESSDDFETHIKQTFLTAKYDTNTRWRLTKKILRLIDHPTKDIDTLQEFALKEDTETTLSRLRNNYAHKTRLQLEESHTPEKCIQIREELRSQLANLDSIQGSE